MKPYKPCQNHPDRESQSFCHFCKTDYCGECLVEGPEYYYCRKSECQKAFKEGRCELAKVSGGPGKMSDADWVTLHDCPNLESAQIARIRWMAKGFETRILDERPIVPGLEEGKEPEGEVQLQVHAFDLHDALKLYRFDLPKSEDDKDAKV